MAASAGLCFDDVEAGILLLLIKLAPHLFGRWAEIVGQILSILPTSQQLLIFTPRLVVLVTIIVRRLQRKIALL